MAKKESFSSIIGFILVAIGLSFGIGSLWRFPYIAAKNGGASFILIYILIIFILCIPLMTAEISIGFSTQLTAVNAYKEIESEYSKWHFSGYLHLVAAIIILGYTAPVYAWIVKYVLVSFNNEFKNMSAYEINNFFNSFSNNHFEILKLFLINLFLNAIVLFFGVQRGLERVSKILLPLLFISMTIIIIYIIQLPDAKEGIMFLFKPNFSKFTFSSLVICLGQAFFATGLAMLGSMVFGSYIGNPKENIFKSSTIICSSLVLASIAAGLIIIPVVFSSHLNLNEGPALTFLTLPNAFNLIPGGHFLSIIFYFGFYIAGFTSSVGVLEAIVGFFMDTLNITRRRALTISIFLVLLIAIPSIFSNAFFNFMDKLENNYILIIGAFLIDIFCGYIWGIENCIKSANITNPYIKLWMKISIKYIAPISIIFIFITQFKI